MPAPPPRHPGTGAGRSGSAAPAGGTVPAGMPTVATADDVCAREPIHVPGAIQPHGVLLGLDAGNRVVVASANVAAMLGRDAAALAGRPAAELLGEAQLSTLLGAVTPRDPDGVGGPFRFRMPADGPRGAASGALAGAEVDVLVHRSGGLTIVELEPVLDALGAGAMSYRVARAALGRVTAATTVEQLCDVLAGEVHELTGFDRVLVYRFDETWNGEVVAERRRPDMEAYLGLRYPASDIPAQARALYVRNWTRLIADASYTPSPLVPDRDPSSGGPVDLSRSVLRSVSPIHLRYLANMGVRASMSLSLVVDGTGPGGPGGPGSPSGAGDAGGPRLWGLVACHHGAPHRPSFDSRSAAEFLAQVASTAIEERERSDARDAARRSAARAEALADRLGRGGSPPVAGLVDLADAVRELLAADAVAVRTVEADGARVLTSDPELRPAVAGAVADVLARAQPGATVATTDQLAAVDPRTAALAEGFAGALRLELGEGRWLLVLRRELRHTVSWGGDPEAKIVSAGPDESPSVGPRESFARWQQVVRGRSAPWRPWETEAAAGLREVVDRLRIRRAREQLFVAESLQRALVMPVAPTIPGVELATRYRPSESGILGGDWWDVVPVGEGRSALVVGDVSGHGVDAAATMAQIRTSLRTYLLDGTSPSEALDRLDRTVGALMRRTIATCVVAVVDPGAGTVAVVGAAHLPPVLVRARPGADGRRAEALATATRPPLGVRLAAGLDPTVVTVSPGDTLTLFSDGLVERRDRGLDDTLAALLALVDRHPPEPGRLEHWLGEVVDAGVGDGTDDTTVLAARLRA